MDIFRIQLPAQNVKNSFIDYKLGDAVGKFVQCFDSYLHFHKKIATDCRLLDLCHNDIGANIKRLVRYTSYLRMECMNSGENLVTPHLRKRTGSYFYLKNNLLERRTI